MAGFSPRLGGWPFRTGRNTLEVSDTSHNLVCLKHTELSFRDRERSTASAVDIFSCYKISKVILI